MNEKEMIRQKEKEIKNKILKESPIEKIGEYPFYFKGKCLKLEILKLKASSELKINLKL